MAFITASMLAIDVGMLMTARSQAQNAADAGALAGATALVYDSWDRPSPAGPAVTKRDQRRAAEQGHERTASRSARRTSSSRSIRPAQPNRVKVTVYRTTARGNPVSTLIAKYFGIATADISRRRPPKRRRRTR